MNKKEHRNNSFKIIMSKEYKKGNKQEKNEKNICVRKNRDRETQRSKTYEIGERWLSGVGEGREEFEDKYKSNKRNNRKASTRGEQERK